MINYLLGLLLREATLTLSDGVAIWGAATPARDDNSGDESWESRWHSRCICSLRDRLNRLVRD